MRVSKREYIPLKGIVNPFVRERLNGGRTARVTAGRAADVAEAARPRCSQYER